jgi:uncharacterized membrane protein
VHNGAGWEKSDLGASTRATRLLAMAQFLQQPLVQIVLWLAALAMLIALGVYLVGRVRAMMVPAHPTSSDLMTDFREIYSQGDLSDEEYRAIKGTLTGRLQREVKGGGEHPSADRRKDLSPGEPLPSLRMESLKRANMGAGSPPVDGVSDTRH